MADDFKVSVESLHVNKIKEINYEGEETLQEKPTVSQKLTELAQRVDFTDSIESSPSEPPPKKGTQKWPWESPHSKLKQALTEISVLSDVLQMVHHHRNYIALDPVLSNPSSSPSPTQQFIVKKKALEKAGEILQRGAVPLTKSSSRGEQQYHQTLSNMRERWRLRRLPNGLIVGDLGYHSAGSYMRPVFFEVSKCEGSSDGVLKVSIPRELRGKSEVMVFISENPVSDIPSIRSVQPTPFDKHFSKTRNGLPQWEIDLLNAQNVLFNQELFAMTAKEAYNIKPVVQHNVSSNRINVLLAPKCWLSIIHAHEYDGDSPTHTVAIPPNWELVVVLKQLLRARQTKVATLTQPRPASLGFSDYSSKIASASVMPSKSSQIIELTKEKGIFRQFLEKAKHFYYEKLVYSWLSDLCTSCHDPALTLTCEPNRAMDNTIYTLTMAGRITSVLFITLSVDNVTVKHLNGEELVYKMAQDKILSAVKHQILMHQSAIASSIAETMGWMVLSTPNLAPSLLQSEECFDISTTLTLQSPNALRKLDLVLMWGEVSITLAEYTGSVTSASSLAALAVDNRTIAYSEQYGTTFEQKLTSTLNSL